MTLPEILGIISVILLTVSLTFIILVYFKKHGSIHLEDHFEGLEDSLRREVEEIKTAMTKSLFESMIEFNNGVNKQLMESSSKSGDNITEFRINVNNALGEFQTKINEQLTIDFKGLTLEINEKMMQINQKVEDRLSKGFSDTNQTFVQIAERVKVIDEAQKKIESLSTEMIGLQNILSNNQARGSFGEYQLTQILNSVFGDNPKLYRTQVTIKEPVGKQESVRADAVVYMPEPNGMLAIDSKFPFSSYSKLLDNNELSKDDESKLVSSFGMEVKKHITDISSKYIIPGKTAPFALMFVPSDGILALIHSKLLNVIEYAREKHVTIVSPSTIIPLFSSFNALIKDYEISKNSKEIRRQISLLQKDFRLFDQEWKKLNSNIQGLTKQSDTVNNRVDKITSKFETIKEVDFQDDSDESEEMLK